MKTNDFLILIVICILGYLIFDQKTSNQEKTEVVDHTKELKSLSSKIDSLNSKVDPLVTERIDHILNKEYEGIEECIDTIWNNGSIEYHWKGCD